MINGFEHPLCPIITDQNPDTIQLFQWGFVPHYELNIKKGNTINAVYETLDQRVTYKNYTSQRCLIPVTGMYEWKTVGKYNTPHFSYSTVKLHFNQLSNIWDYYIPTKKFLPRFFHLVQNYIFFHYFKAKI